MNTVCYIYNSTGILCVTFIILAGILYVTFVILAGILYVTFVILDGILYVTFIILAGILYVTFIKCRNRYISCYTHLLHIWRPSHSMLFECHCIFCWTCFYSRPCLDERDYSILTMDAKLKDLDERQCSLYSWSILNIVNYIHYSAYISKNSDIYIYI